MARHHTDVQLPDCWAPNYCHQKSQSGANDEGRETVLFGTDDCEGGDELGGLLDPRCQSRLFHPDDPRFFQDELDHEDPDQSVFHDTVRFRSSTGIFSSLKTWSVDSKAGGSIGSAKNQDLQ